MSTRWYPIYQRGNPQLRIFLPNFWMKIVKPDHHLQNQRKNVVQFHVSMEMTKYDIKNYLEKIYKIPVVKVNTIIKLGKIRRNELNTIIKDDDMKIAYVSLPRYETFEYPELFKDERKLEEKKKEESVMEDAKQAFQDSIKPQRESRPGLPPWFSI